MSTVKEYTFGMECEYNKNEHAGFLRRKPSWFVDHGYENCVIKEDGTKPTTAGAMIRRAFYMGEVFGAQHDRGCYDRYAGSFHLHIRHKELIEFSDVNISVFTPLLLWATHMSRNGEQWRDAVCNRSPLYTIGNIPHDTKSSWLTHNSRYDTLELRLNESPCPYMIIIMLPVLVAGMQESELVRIDEILDINPHSLPKADEIQDPLRRKFKPLYLELIQKAKVFYKGHPTIQKIIRMDEEGHSRTAIHIMLREHFKDNTVIKKMFDNTGGY